MYYVNVYFSVEFPAIPNNPCNPCSATAGLHRLDSTDIQILQKIENHSRSYGTVPVLYHKIGDQILNRKDYDNIDINSPKVTYATQTENVENNCSQISVATQTCTAKHKNLDSEYMPSSSIQTTIKNSHNRNFVLENIQKAKYKHRMSSIKSKKSTNDGNVKKESEMYNKRTPSTVKSLRKNLKKLKRRSLQFSTDDYDGNTAKSVRINTKFYPAHLKETCDDQLKCVITMGNTLDQMRNDVDEIVQLQNEIGIGQTDSIGNNFTE